MATITIGGRELDVRPATLGFVRRALLPWKKSAPVFEEPADLAAAADLEAAIIDWQVAGALLYIGHNDGITADWLLEHVRDAGELLRELARASGQTEPAPGEAARP